MDSTRIYTTLKTSTWPNMEVALETTGVKVSDWSDLLAWADCYFE